MKNHISQYPNPYPGWGCYLDPYRIDGRLMLTQIFMSCYQAAKLRGLIKLAREQGMAKQGRGDPPSFFVGSFKPLRPRILLIKYALQYFVHIV